MAIGVGTTSTAGNASGTNLTVTAPTSIADNDILVACAYREAGAWTPPADCTSAASAATVRNIDVQCVGAAGTAVGNSLRVHITAESEL